MDGSPLGRLFQVGVIVRDVDQATMYYQALGIGPFEKPQASGITDRRVYGRPAPDVQNRVASARLGPIQFELVQPVTGQSVQREFLEKHGEGINHLGFYVDDLDKEVARLEAQGFRVVSSGRVAGGGFAYLDTDKVGGVQFELVQLPPK